MRIVVLVAVKYYSRYCLIYNFTSGVLITDLLIKSHYCEILKKFLSRCYLIIITTLPLNEYQELMQESNLPATINLAGSE